VHGAVLQSWLALAAVGLGCGRTSAPTDSAALSPADRKILGTMSPLPAVAPDPTNAVAEDPRAAALGQMLFFDEALAGPLLVASERGAAGELGKVACRSCHAGPAMDDPGKHVSIGGKPGTRNSPPVINSVFYRWTNWGGRFDTQWALVLGALEKADVMNGTRLAIVHVVRTKYRAEYEALFGPLDEAFADAARFPSAGKPGVPAWEAMTVEDRARIDVVFARIGKVVAAYMRLLVARNAPFDRYIAGDEGAISVAAKRGATLFVKHCASCHGGPLFSDDKFHAIGAAQFGAGVPEVDLGRFTDVADMRASAFNAAGVYSDAKRVIADEQTASQRGQFRTPSLRNVAVTAPYMHAGQFATLDAVMNFYNIGGGKVDGVTKSDEMKPLGLTREQQADVVAFMQTLTDTAVPPALLVDTAR
jgi:cytochrome c peroxidase